ncbi:hypothetical protein CABS02_15271 [Colletotrichum abscissum]|uniref:Uncharacterized protein n=1 Tax=Colletotrichum abscissum TaxID=1671311 RepID=A0A9P9WZQ1_9PEZI|nr:hypothetical protein CABS02_15271 [Colletotrichum abscissum]
MSITVNINVNINLNLDNLIASCQRMGRAEAVQNLLNETAQELRTKHHDKNLHILILSLSQSQRCQPQLNDIVFYANFKWAQGIDAHDFGVWIFRSGEIDHTKEDGGWINWGFTGGQRSGRNGGHVKW